MTSYNAIIELDGRVDDKLATALVEQLADHHPAAGRGLTGHQDVTITVQAENLRQATITALALVQAVGHEPWAVQVLPADEFDRRLGLDPVPELLSVTEVANALGVSRSAVQQRIDAGSLPAKRVGNSWAVPAIAVPR